MAEQLHPPYGDEGIGMFVNSCDLLTQPRKWSRPKVSWLHHIQQRASAVVCGVIILLTSSVTLAQSDSAHPEASETPSSVAQGRSESSPPAPSPLPDAAPTTGVTGSAGNEQGAAGARIEERVALEPPAPPDNKFKLDVGGGMILFYNQPLEGPNKGSFEVFEAKIRIDATFGMFGLHIVPIARDTRERAFFPSSVWVQEAYGFAKLGPVTVKAGKVFAQFGRFWDNSFYGNVQEYDGFKLDPNHGISFEGKLGATERMGLEFFAQYFINDGTTNYSLPGRDTVSIPGARRRHYVVGRAEPFLKVGAITTLKLGLSAGHFVADLPTIGKQSVTRLAVDGTATIGGLTAWAEYTRQIGRHVVDFPIAPVTDASGVVTMPGRSADAADYAMIGGEYTLNRFTFRYNYNLGSYNVGVKEARHIPGIAVAFDEHLFVLFEWALEHRYIRGQTTVLGNSLNLTIHGKV